MPVALSRIAVWTLLAAPLVLLTYNYAFETTYLLGEVYYGGYVHGTGRWAAWALLAALAATPLRFTFPSSIFARWYLNQRRYLGVASFAYATAHLTAYLLRQEWDIVAEDFATAAFWSGYIAFAIFAVLALTSNDLSLRLLRRAWKNLHRLVYPAAALTFAHWALTAFDPFTAYCHIAALALLESYRVFLNWRPRRALAA
jgi:sulfoxide reductase heme-binding subunit YedZ